MYDLTTYEAQSLVCHGFLICAALLLSHIKTYAAGDVRSPARDPKLRRTVSSAAARPQDTCYQLNVMRTIEEGGARPAAAVWEATQVLLPRVSCP